MTERLLQYIWQFQHFNKSELATAEHEGLQIIQPGLYNTNQGPDFLDAKIRIGNTTWAGSIELHINSSDWKNHKHASDKNYKNVILHVVWQHDIDLQLPFSTLVLQEKVPKILLERYDELMNAAGFIPCEKTIHAVNDISWLSWKERLLIERLESRSKLIFEQLDENNAHWEEVFWWLLAKNFGAKVNTDSFEKIARSVSINILSRHKSQVQQLEALLFGQAGLLEETFAESYPRMLQKEYRFLKNKYKLQPIAGSLLFLRMRPSNFPTVRLAQLAMLIHESVHLFSTVKSAPSLSEIRSLLNITANDYWHYHYVFDETTAFKTKNLGSQMSDTLLINAIVPIIFAYGHYHKDDQYKDKALDWLSAIHAEKNLITRKFETLGMINKTAFDSQAFIQLKNEYCNKKRCLECRINPLRPLKGEL
jgi:hypothetical protein